MTMHDCEACGEAHAPVLCHTHHGNHPRPVTNAEYLALIAAMRARRKEDG